MNILFDRVGEFNIHNEKIKLLRTNHNNTRNIFQHAVLVLEYEYLDIHTEEWINYYGERL